jgi:hypothetical protein
VLAFQPRLQFPPQNVVMRREILLYFAALCRAPFRPSTAPMRKAMAVASVPPPPHHPLDPAPAHPQHFSSPSWTGLPRVHSLE